MILSLLAAISSAAAPKNILLICIDDLRPELNAFGADYIQSPNIDQLAQVGRPFHRHYVNAPSCGSSRFTMLTGRYGSPGNDALFKRAHQYADDPASVPPSMPEWFRKNGYTTVSVGKVSHHPGGLGGSDWNDESKIELPNGWDRYLMPCGEWQHPRGAMHGLSNGQTRTRKNYPALESVEGPDTLYPDGLIADEGMRQLEELASSEKPFFLAIGLIKPHLPFGAPAQYMKPYKDLSLPPIPHPEKPQGRTTWHSSGEMFGRYDHGGLDPRNDAAYADRVRRHYAACVTYADKHVGDIMSTLRKSGADKNTIVILWGDHGWHLGEHGIWGKHALFEESLRSPLIVYVPGMEKPGIKTEAVVSTLDLFPTLCDLTKVPVPDFITGVSLSPMIKNPDTAGHIAYSYWGDKITLRTDTHRMILHRKDGFVELYDHTTPDKETVNIAAEHPDLVAELKSQLEAMRK